MTGPVSLITKSFENKYAGISKVIAFDYRWRNGTGYFDGAVEGPHAVNLEPGEEAKSYDDVSGRKMIFIGTFLGPIVIFARYTDPKSSVYVYNATQLLDATKIFGSTALGYDALNFIFTGGYNGEPYNIEGYLRHLKEVLTYVDKPKATDEQIADLRKVCEFIVAKGPEAVELATGDEKIFLTEFVSRYEKKLVDSEWESELRKKTADYLDRRIESTRAGLERIRKVLAAK